MKIIFDSEEQKNSFIRNSCVAHMFKDSDALYCSNPRIHCRECWEQAVEMEVLEKEVIREYFKRVLKVQDEIETKEEKEPSLTYRDIYNEFVKETHIYENVIADYIPGYNNGEIIVIFKNGNHIVYKSKRCMKVKEESNNV